MKPSRAGSAILLLGSASAFANPVESMPGLRGAAIARVHMELTYILNGGSALSGVATYSTSESSGTERSGRDKSCYRSGRP